MLSVMLLVSELLESVLLVPVSELLVVLVLLLLLLLLLLGPLFVFEEGMRMDFFPLF